MESTKPPLTRGIKVSYGVGQAAEGIKNAAFNVFVFFYYTQVLGLPTVYTGIAIGIALAVDSITDPLIGSLSDNWQGSNGRRHPFLYVSILPLGLFFIGLFNPPELEEFTLFLWLTVFSVGTRAMMTLYYVPHVSLGAELSEDFNERTEVVAYRYFFSYVGGILTYIIGFVVYFPDTQFNVEAYAPFGLTLSLLMMASILITALGTKRRIPHLPASRINRESVSILRVLHKTLLEIRSALTNRSFRWLFAGVLIVFAMVGVDNALNLHMNTYFWELQGGGNLFFFAATPVGALIGTALASPLTRWFDKKPSVIIGTLCWALCQVIPVVLRLLGWFPENGTDELLYSLIVIKFIQGLGVVQALIAFNSMVADVVDEHELITGLRQEGIFFSSVSFSNKMTSGIGTVAAGFALALIDWPTGAAVQTAADIAPETIAWLGLIYGPIVSGFALVSAYCYSKYGLNRQRHAEVVEELAVLRERRAAAAD
jgi:GPH family glycoside/pentoside/hexuronide:cation symporter